MGKNRPTDPNFFQQGTVNTHIFFFWGGGLVKVAYIMYRD